MESFQWGEHFITGLPDVDKQHQQLVALLNKFSSALSVHTIEPTEVETLFSELTAYASLHFEDEESLMEKLQLDSRHTTIHVDEHQNFMEEVKLLHLSSASNKESDLRTLHDFLINWLAYHILGSDQNMARQIDSINKGFSPMEAYLAEEREASSATEPLLVALKGLFQQVSTRNRMLYDLNQSLEKKVLERTEELQEANAHLEILALTDVLTGLPNRRSAMIQLKALWSEAAKTDSSLSCMMIDADGFKAINDQYGHDAGDQVLKILGKELHNSVRNDDVVCRLGGDEFIIICPNTSLAGAMYISEITRKKIADLRVPAGAGVWYGSVSIGVAVTGNSIHSIDDLIKTADKSVYLAKADGKNCVRTIQE